MAIRQTFRVILWNPREFAKPVDEKDIQLAVNAAVKDWIDVQIQNTGIDRYVETGKSTK